MDSLKRRWQKVPQSIRRPVIFVLGLLFVIAAGLTGWLPGPGGIPLFLIGIAIWATEFEWAKKVRDMVVDRIHMIGAWLRTHKILGTFLIVLGLAIALTLSIIVYRHFK